VIANNLLPIYVGVDASHKHDSTAPPLSQPPGIVEPNQTSPAYLSSHLPAFQTDPLDFEATIEQTYFIAPETAAL
jgi:hypothetical protein